MTQENVEVVRRACEAFNQGDLEGLLDFVHPEIEVRPDPGLPDWRVFEGREGFLAIAETWLEPWDTRGDQLSGRSG
jgi:ketosteroid isomerase-like protein